MDTTYTLEKGQVYGFGLANHPENMQEIMIEAVQGDRVTYSLFEYTPFCMAGENLGCATVPISWLITCLVDRRAYLLTEWPHSSGAD